MGTCVISYIKENIFIFLFSIKKIKYYYRILLFTLGLNTEIRKKYKLVVKIKKCEKNSGTYQYLMYKLVYNLLNLN